MDKKLLDEVMQQFEISAKIRPYAKEMSRSWDDLSVRFHCIREMYKIMTPEIIKANGREDPYFADFCSFMTPIERNIWSDIRSSPLYFFPQYPVGRFFVDFGDPVNKVAIEADGKVWHSASKDAKRDAELLDLGWTVFHITGKDTYAEEAIYPVLNHYGFKTPEEQYH